jgi:hypothetical protein
MDKKRRKTKMKIKIKINKEEDNVGKVCDFGAK